MKKKTSLTTKEDFLQRIEAGEEKSVRGWADIYFPDHEERDNKVRGMMLSLRNHGHMLFPVPLKEGQPGIVKKVNDNATQFSYVYSRHAIKAVENNLVKNAFYAERLLQNHPRLKEKTIEVFKSIVTRAIELNKELIAIDYVAPKQLKK